MAVATTGFFDGVHLGHRSVIETLLKTASARGERSLVLTFWPHPRAVLRDEARSLRLLCSRDEKRARLLAAGVDEVRILPFTKDFASMTAIRYLEMLRRDYDVSAIVLGYDNRFGSDRCSTARICEIAAELGIEATVVDALGAGETAMSSTLIRKALGEGRVRDAAAMLGYDYCLEGVVVSGNRMGRTIGYPTANMKLREPLKCVPRVGAYICRVEIEGREFVGMTNIDHNEKIETHILDFSEDIYGLDMKISFSEKLRDEIRFASFDQLKEQLLEDEARVRELSK